MWSGKRCPIEGPGVKASNWATEMGIPIVYDEALPDEPPPERQGTHAPWVGSKGRR